MGRDKTDFWRSVRDYPERLERKAHEKRKMQEEKEDVARERKMPKTEERLVRKIEQPHPPCCNDWLCHDRNINFARNRSDFDIYTALDTTAIAAPDDRYVNVFGIGTVKFNVKRQLGQNNLIAFTLKLVLHIPEARCNGISLPLVKENGLDIKDRNDGYFTIRDTRNQGSVCCGSVTRGRRRIFIAGEEQETTTLPHVTYPGHISISADRKEVDALHKWVKFC